MTTKRPQLSDPVNVRLPVEVAAEIREESIETGVPESVLIRKAVLLGRRREGVSSVPMSYDEHAKTATTLHRDESGNTPTSEREGVAGG